MNSSCFASRFNRCWVCILCLLANSPSIGLAREASKNDSESTQLYRYRMKGKVRPFLFFWVSKDNVGGGTISIRKQLDLDSGSWKEEIEVLFGSHPDQVPGRINRWGYGKEVAQWEIIADHQEPALKETIFEGFMRHSQEDTLNEVRDNNDQEQSEERFWYEGIRSIVRPSDAVSEIRTFSSAHDFVYTNPTAIHDRYEERINSGPPDKVKLLLNQEEMYLAPFGFLTALRQLMEKIVGDFERDRQNNSLKGLVSPYAFNAKFYRLRLKKAKLKKTFDLPLQGGGKKIFSDVVQAEFRIENVTDDNDHDFTIWFPLKGPYQGVPLRIVDKPRWWLKVELNLEPDEGLQRVQAEQAQRQESGDK